MKNKKALKILHEVLDITKTLFTAFTIAYFVNHALIANAHVPTGSMEPTIEVNSMIILNRLAYAGEKEPARGDIISFYPPDGVHYDSDGKPITYLKRVIGLPNETIEGRDGRIYIDGELLTEKYITIEIESDFGPYTIPEDCYFVMGDNRNNSWDSRYWNNKFVSKYAIIGRAEFKYLPTWKVFSKE